MHKYLGITSFTYDAQGNILKESTPQGTTSFEYNALNQQTKVTTYQGNTLINRYDAEGLRAEIEENQKLTRFIFHKDEILVEADENDTPISRFARGYNVVASDVKGSEQLHTERYYYQLDEQFSTSFIINGSGKVENRYSYDAFGNILESQESVHNRIKYTSQQYDEITQQYYLRARFYNPVLGRFTQEDVYRGDGLNLYSYCNQNPVIYYDPSGYAFVDNPLYNSQEDIDNRTKYTPAVDADYGHWEDPNKRGNSNFIAGNEKNLPQYANMQKVLDSHGTNVVPFKDAMVDFDNFAVFTVEVEVSPNRGTTHPRTNKEIAKIIIDHNGNYDTMRNGNVMGIASGTSRSQEIAKSVINDADVQKLVNSSLSDKKKTTKLAEKLDALKVKNGQVIHEDYLKAGSTKSNTQWVDKELNNNISHPGGTSDAKKRDESSDGISNKKCK